jgi:hypothetical protein
MAQRKFLSWRRQDDLDVSACLTGTMMILTFHAHRSIIIEAIRSCYEGDVTVAFFYCEHQEPEKCDPFKLLGTILHQILRKFRPPFPPPIAALIDRHSSNHLGWTLPALGDLICEFTKGDNIIFLVIDALDECEQRANLLLILRQLSRHLPLFITSRHEGDIRTSLDEYARYQIPIQPCDIEAEIQQFVQEEIKDRLRNRLLLVGDQGLVDEIIETLVAGADGM